MEEKNKDFFKRFLNHVRWVQDGMIFLEKISKNYDFLPQDNFVLANRSLEHDLDKIMNDENIESYINSFLYFDLKNKKLSNDHIDIEKHKNTIVKRHYETMRHHFFANNIDENIIDICEMCCDTNAISIEEEEKNNTTYFKEVMLKKYDKLKKYEDLCLSIYYLLKDMFEDDLPENKKNIFLDKYLKYIRDFQNFMVILEFNKEDLGIEFKDWEIIRTSFNIHLNTFNDYTFKNIDDRDKIYYYILENKINNIENKDLIDYCAFCWFAIIYGVDIPNNMDKITEGAISKIELLFKTAKYTR